MWKMKTNELAIGDWVCAAGPVLNGEERLTPPMRVVAIGETWVQLLIDPEAGDPDDSYEMKRIQGFGEDYVLIGSKAEQTKFIGNAVEVSQATAICVATAEALQQATTTTCHANTPFHGK